MKGAVHHDRRPPVFGLGDLVGAFVSGALIMLAVMALLAKAAQG